MGMANKAPERKYNRQHIIKQHAIERLQEYAKDVGRAANGQVLGDLIDEALVESIMAGLYEQVYDIEENRCLLIAFDRPYWADPGLFILAHEEGTVPPRFSVRTMLTEGAVTDMKAKKKITPREKELPPVVTVAPFPGSMVELPQPVVSLEARSITWEDKMGVAQREIVALSWDIKKATEELRATKDELKASEMARELMRQSAANRAKESAREVEESLGRERDLVAKLDQAERVLQLFMREVLASRRVVGGEV